MQRNGSAGGTESLPSDEGSGLKYGCSGTEGSVYRLPSDEGSGLKCHKIIYLSNDWERLPSDEGSGLKCLGMVHEGKILESSLG